MTVSELPSNTSLRHVTYEEILEVAKAKTPIKGSTRAAWLNFQEACRSLQQSETIAGLSANRHWLLRKLTVEGFRGAQTSLTLNVDPHPGITVIHGANGMGKSTFAEALRAALWGEVGSSFIGEPRKPGSLWKPIDINKSSTTASIYVELIASVEPSTRLEFWLEMSTTDGTDVVDARGRLTEEGETTEIEDGARASFRAALLSAPPVLAYADMANDLRDKAHLLSWLTASLGMGPLLDGIEASITEASLDSAAASTLLKGAQQRAQSELDEIDASARETGLPNVVTPQLPIFTDIESRNEWLEAADISERTQAEDSYDEAADTEVTLFARELSKAFKSISELADTKVLFFESLEALKAASDGRHLHPELDWVSCPSCGSRESDWRAHVDLMHKELEVYRKANSGLFELVARAQSEILEPLGRVTRILATSSPGFDPDGELSRRLVATRTAIAPGHFPDLNGLAALSNLAEFIVSENGFSARKEAIEKSDVVHDWHCERWKAVSPFLQIWTENSSSASKAALWKATKSCCTQVIRVFRDERNKALSSGINSNVAILLKEFGLKIEALRLTKSDADFGLLDLNGAPVNLGELSAGQRNALILAPMLATADSSLFGFTVLDDPVHAFDEFRVDHLSAVLARIGEGQRLIVTTHDSRLVEQLRLHAGSNFELVEINRDHTAGSIEFVKRSSPSEELLETVGQLIGLAKAGMTGLRDWSDVEALLRLAVDEALTSCFLRATLGLDTESRQEKLKVLEKKDLLPDRIACLVTEAGLTPTDVDALNAVSISLGDFMPRWNRAIHGNAQETDLTVDQILAQKQATKLACKKINEMAK